MKKDIAISRSPKHKQKRNKKKSKKRARIEHIFGFMTNSMNRMYIRCRNFVRAEATIGLMKLTYNLFRLTQIKVNLKTMQSGQKANHHPTKDESKSQKAADCNF